MLSLILIRHAKSSWDFPVDDKERPLTDKGIDAIITVAKKAKELLPEKIEVWSSTARRAIDTAVLFCESNNISKYEINLKDSLYTFNSDKLEKEIKKCSNEIKNLIVFGHNDAITDIVNKFGNKFIFTIPTAGFIFIKFEQNKWEDINKGTILKKIFPKEISNE